MISPDKVHAHGRAAIFEGTLPHSQNEGQHSRQQGVNRLGAISQGIDTSNDSPCGKFQPAVLMAVAKFERGIIRERVRSGLAAAKARGVKLGRPATLNGRSKEVLALQAKGLGVCAISR
jgi:hypothetical protein